MKLNDEFLPRYQLIVVLDNEEAKRYVEAFELTDLVRLASHRPERAVLTMAHDHETHWLVVGLIRGHDKPEENGLSFMAIPKATCTVEVLHDSLRSHVGSSYTEIHMDSQQPPARW